MNKYLLIFALFLVIATTDAGKGKGETCNGWNECDHPLSCTSIPNGKCECKDHQSGAVKPGTKNQRTPCGNASKCGEANYKRDCKKTCAAHIPGC